MANYVKLASEEIKEIMMSALGKLVADKEIPAIPLPPFSVEIPNDTTHGDFATNLAMVSGKAFKEAGIKFNPREFAGKLCAAAILDGTLFDRCEVAGPGFINFFLSPKWFASVVKDVVDCGADFGRSDYGKGEKVMIEFVSANPTGPMHMGNARGGALGDCLAAAMDMAGFDVTREFYINDAGNQIEKFGISLEARYLQIYLGEDAVAFPEDAYHGEDIKERAQLFADVYGDRFVKADPKERQNALIEFALPKNIEKLQNDLGLYRIKYDVWFRESSLHNSGAVKKALDELTAKGMTYEKEGALWYKNSDVMKEQLLKQGKTPEQIEELGLKDDVLVRANGHPTYFAADIAYHYNKFVVRGFDRVINVWGADHHGHVARLKGAMDAIGLNGDKLDIVLMQLVRLMKDGQPYKMSKRSGKAVSLTDLIEDIPIDAARFFFNLSSPNSTLDFDLDLAVEQSSQNPVYYVQYAHARICSILKKLEADGVTPRGCTLDELCLLTLPEEIELIRALAEYPNMLVEVAKNYDPARMTRYSMDLATVFHKFYNSCRVADDNEALMYARLTLCIAVKNTIANVLGLMKVSAPKSM
ncbi:arginyl-tRNA synthetase [Hydrogenoanaerobacterium saccharovorans]|uniref:Arginine--tRNA ligase n=1 Tax=Hydrogenoanaerobacterium saccharovorans TaxID=474960 RepID=A0A1H8BBZ8_9FIRM|nr:arginine--tRNA ligase [Hydrogenoanaerobacterium saccharovorans]RPF47483.1 arginyl-tRNA synthetase [Hydrogenoanaerobacterium saccharovorans]SEM80491.1 arginyl-tRNA synthetase [Hydrogenoanaerobacterium saccharovorans]